jgi:hypothetical protein
MGAVNIHSSVTAIGESERWHIYQLDEPSYGNP